MQPPELEKLINESRDYQMTDAEREEQRRSFVYGNCSIENPAVTREVVDRVADRLAGIERKPDITLSASRLTEVLLAAETAIRDLGLGSAGSVRLDAQDPELGDWELCFRKYEKRWTLLFENQETENVQSLSTASLRMRIAGARLVPTLVDVLHENWKSRLEEIDTTTRELEAFVETLRKKT
jgi:hypothetical protein